MLFLGIYWKKNTLMYIFTYFMVWPSTLFWNIFTHEAFHAQKFEPDVLSCCCSRLGVMCVSWSAGLCPLAVLTPSSCVGCVLNACSSYPCHSGPHHGVHRRLPGLAQLEAAQHQKHELRQPGVPQDHRGGRRRDPHRAQRADRTHLPSREWKPQAAVLSSPFSGRDPRPGRSLVLRGAHAGQHKVKTEKKSFTAG